jgi:flagellar biosynthetic protein FliR
LHQLLSDFVAHQLFTYLLIFTRIGAALVLLPGIGEVFIPPRVRLSLALIICFILLPIIGPTLPKQPSSVIMLAGLLITEATIGFFFGAVTRLVLSSLEVAGMIISSQMGLSAAMLLNPVMGSQGSLMSVFLTMLGLGLVFAADLHHVFIRAVIETYSLVTPGQAMPIEDMVQTIGHGVSQSFKVGVQLSAPFLLMGTVFYTALGMLSRLMPQMQVFFIAVPLQIIMGLMLMILTLSGMMLWYIDYFNTAVQSIYASG